MNKEKEKDEKLHNEEVIFLKGELKRVEGQINKTGYSEINNQKKLWELREHILQEISKFLDIYIMTFSQAVEVKGKNLKE